MSEALKPYPFCGGAARIGKTNKCYSNDEEESYEDGHAVYCTNAECKPSGSYGGWHFETRGYKTEQEAISAWNRRTEDAQP